MSVLGLLLVGAGGCAPIEGTVLELPPTSMVVDAPEDARTPLPPRFGEAWRRPFELLTSDAGPLPDASAAVDASALYTACPGESFVDEFEGDMLDPARWAVAHGPAQWAATPVSLARENVAVEQGALILRVHGDAQAGVAPVSRNQSLVEARRSGAAVATLGLYGYGSFVATMSLRAPRGVQVAMWLEHDRSARGFGLLLSPPARAQLPTEVAVASDAERSQPLTELRELPPSADLSPSRTLRFLWSERGPRPLQLFVGSEEVSTGRAPDAQLYRLWLVAYVRAEVQADFESAEIRIERVSIAPSGDSRIACPADARGLPVGLEPLQGAPTEPIPDPILAMQAF